MSCIRQLPNTLHVLVGQQQERPHIAADHLGKGPVVSPRRKVPFLGTMIVKQKNPKLSRVAPGKAGEALDAGQQVDPLLTSSRAGRDGAVTAVCWVLSLHGNETHQPCSRFAGEREPHGS